MKRKIRGKDLYRVINTETKEVKSEGSTLEDAKKQLRLLRSLEKKEMKAIPLAVGEEKSSEQSGGSLKASQIKKAIDLSYQGSKTTDAPKGYEIDKELSDGRVKVYKDVNSDQALVVHRGSSGTRDWIDNVRYGLTGQMKTTDTFKKHSKKHQKALDKYGAENIIAVGHSRAGKYVEELNKENPVKEVITYNKASGPSDLFRKNPKNQTDIRTDIDVVSALAPLQSHENKVVTVPSNSWNPLTAHGTTPLGKLGEKLLGKGFVGGVFNPKKLKVSEMRKFIKAFKKQNNEKWTGSKIGKSELVKIFENEILKNENIDELVGGSIWTDFVKEFSSRHSLKYACSLSKYKEPLKSAYKKFKEGKDWYEPLNLPPSTIGLIEKPKEPVEEEEEEIKIVTKKQEPELSSIDKRILELRVLDKQQLLKIIYEIMDKKKVDKTMGNIEMDSFGREVQRNYITRKGLKQVKKEDIMREILKFEEYNFDDAELLLEPERGYKQLKRIEQQIKFLENIVKKRPDATQYQDDLNKTRAYLEDYKNRMKNAKKSGGAKYYKPNFLPPLISKYETELKKMTKAELQNEVQNNDLDYSEQMTKLDLITLLMENAGQEFGSRYHYSTDYPNCEVVIRKAHQCYGKNSVIEQHSKQIKQLKNDYSKISEKIKQVQRRPVAINNKRMMREDKKEMENLISLRENILKNIKKSEDKIKENDYLCQGKINELIKCEKYRVNKDDDDEEIEDPIDWENRTKLRKVSKIKYEDDEDDEENEGSGMILLKILQE
jgi:hypothetical protein